MDVLCVGHAAWDISVFLDEYPAENSKCETRVLLECGGGPAANAAYLLSSWGVKCALAATLGRDAYADRIVEEFVRAGTDVTLIHRSSQDPTPVSMILVNQRTASRTIVNRKGAGRRHPFGSLIVLIGPSLRGCFCSTGTNSKQSLDAMAHFPESRTILDAGSARPGTVELARRVDYVVASERFARTLSGVPDLETHERQEAAIRTLVEHSGRPVVITCGERGLLHGTGDAVRTPAGLLCGFDRHDGRGRHLPRCAGVRHPERAIVGRVAAARRRGGGALDDSPGRPHLDSAAHSRHGVLGSCSMSRYFAAADWRSSAASVATSKWRRFARVRTSGRTARHRPSSFARRSAAAGPTAPWRPQLWAPTCDSAEKSAPIRSAGDWNDLWPTAA